MPSQIRFILRRLMKSPGFTAVTLLTLAIGIGANTAIFGVINGILLKPLPFADSSRLASVRLTAPGINHPDLEICPALYFLLARDDARVTFDHFTVWQGDSVSVTGLGQPEEVEIVDTTFDMLGALEVAPILRQAVHRLRQRTQIALDRHSFLRILDAKIRWRSERHR